MEMSCNATVLKAGHEAPNVVFHELKVTDSDIQGALSQLSRSERLAYERVLEIVPELVQQESSLAAFLRKELNNTFLAVRRLCRYWAYRKQAFKERWLLPLTQTGTGSLNAGDISILRTGYFLVLPFAQGRAVVLLDESRLPCPIGDFHIRILYYMAHVYREYMENVIYVHVVTGDPRPTPNLDPLRWKIYQEALPATVTQLIVAQAYDPFRERLVDYLAFQSCKVSEYKSGFHAHRVVSDSSHGTLTMLQDLGLTAPCIPLSLGGSFDYNCQLNNWVRLRLSIEEAVSSPPICCYRSSLVPRVAAISGVCKRGTLSSLVDCRLQLHHKQQNTNDTGSHPNRVLPIDVQRKRNALYARRSYEKRKLEVLALQDDVRIAQKQQTVLEAENLHLLQALDECRQLVARNSRLCMASKVSW